MLVFQLPEFGTRSHRFCVGEGEGGEGLSDMSISNCLFCSSITLQTYWTKVSLAVA